MGYPELKSDESIILTAQHVKVKSVPFELVLTNRRLILIDSIKNIIPTQAIPLATIRNVARGENAIRDPVLTLTILTDTADTREMALTFAMQTAGERKREADEWVKTLKKYSAEAARFPAEPAGAPAPQPAPETRVVREPAAIPGTKKRIETPRPIKKIVVDTPHMPPKPVETSSLPEGSFCGRCGNRVPPGSTFCNRCGSKILSDEEISALSTEQSPVQVSTGQPAAPQQQVNSKRPIEQIIHSIEPLIEDSVPRTQPEPEVPSHIHHPETAPTEEETPAAVVPAPEAAPTETATPAHEDTISDAATPTAETPKTAASATEPAPVQNSSVIPPGAQIPPMPPIPPVPAAPAKKRPKVVIAVIAIVIIIAVAAAGIMLMKNMSGNTVTPTVTPTPEMTTAIPTTLTTIPTTVPTTVETTVAVVTTAQVTVPQTGVWVEIIYDKTYSGTVGTPGGQKTVSDTGDNFYSIATKDGLVTAALEKTDGSGDLLTVNVWKYGELVMTDSTSTPNGKLDVQAVLATPTPTPTLTKVPVPTTTVALNSTATAA
ncbi:MAG: hypothetical protein WC342_10060 [Methanoregula sp.]|jgi:ribosomal protein L40E